MHTVKGENRQGNRSLLCVGITQKNAMTRVISAEDLDDYDVKI